MKTTFMRIAATALASFAIVTSLGVASFAAEKQDETDKLEQGYYTDVIGNYEEEWKYDADTNVYPVEWETCDESVFYLR